ncbi:Bro-N domain-containing protein [Candidatus Gracilibacteria bacterium]|nr:Bro-N domain-containing protein [Candidatus Gracilibacteria bacterium]
MPETKLAIFQEKEIRKTYHNDEWWFSVEDIVSVLTESKDPKQYMKRLKSRDEELKNNWGTICTLLEMIAKDGKKRKILCSNTKGAFRIIQSIPSKKAEPFKQWLAQVGYERVQEIEDPELAMERMKSLYEQKGYSKEWIDKRLRGIAVRKDLTDEWDARGIENKQYGILTAEISKATFGMTPSEYKDYKGLTKKSQNLRDHMTDLEIIFTMLGEASTTEIMKNKDSQGFYEVKDASKEGGEIAGNARKKLEEKTKKKVISKENYLTQTKSRKLQ